MNFRHGLEALKLLCPFVSSVPVRWEQDYMQYYTPKIIGLEGLMALIKYRQYT